MADSNRKEKLRLVFVLDLAEQCSDYPLPTDEDLGNVEEAVMRGHLSAWLAFIDEMTNGTCKARLWRPTPEQLKEILEL
ncbi:MAG TPA: hypothetical protein VGP68_14070 [Gemmataceae bacterium]|jgi:hypothetical protein|nr:hypothetical protein [Gemmataceae bacterium]